MEGRVKCGRAWVWAGMDVIVEKEGKKDVYCICSVPKVVKGSEEPLMKELERIVMNNILPGMMEYA